ncbi:MAG TPA: C45 family peptidase [Terriglobales bacterium]|nr:C45 family peptidase [Terriglobales bacterium]
MFRTIARFVVLLLALSSLSLAKGPADSRLKNSFRRPAKHGWTYVHLEGQPAEIGFQHGYLLASEIDDMLKVFTIEMTRDNKKDWQFFRDAARTMMWPRIEPEYREELQAIVDGATAKGVKLDIWDVVALNASMEWEYYVKEYNKEHNLQNAASLVAPEHCSAFVATGSYTRDGKIVIAHNNWTDYLDGARWTIMFDIAPAKGYRMLMDGLPGFIHSGDDFVVNSAGIVITETTIGRFNGYDPNGVPEFVRARKAAQYSNSIDDFARIMKDGNNGGYANNWLLADIKTNEIASLELGLKNVTLEKKTDGYFVGSNFPVNEKLIREETDFDVKNMSLSANARHVRWEQLMSENKGKIDVKAAERFLADHYDTYTKKDEADERTLDGHIDLSPRGSPPWQPPYGNAGAVQNKVADAAMIGHMSMAAHAGHACGKDFKAADQIKDHPEFGWEQGVLRDMDAYPWTKFSTSK